MGLFRYRPLFLWCAAFTAAAAGGYLLFDQFIPAGACAAALFLALIGAGAVMGMAPAGILWRKGRKRQALTVLLAAVAAVLGLWQSYATFGGDDAATVRSLAGREVCVRGVITERRGGEAHFSSFSLELHTANGSPIEGMAVLTCAYDADLRPGDIVELPARAMTLDEAAGDGYSGAALRGDGFVLGLFSEEEFDTEVIGHDRGNLQVLMGQHRRALSARLKDAVGREAAGLPSALLLGNRDHLSDSVRRDFGRIGVSHLLAISGLHMTLLFGLLEGILRLFGVAKRMRATVLGAAAGGYLLLLGFPPSATRAVIMLGLVYLSTLLSARADAVTSLGVAGVGILTATPYAAADAGFWMSYLATLGLLSLMPWLNRVLVAKPAPTGKTPLTARAKRILLRGGVGVLVGVIAMSFTLSVVAAVIGEMSLLSPLSTLMLTPLCGAVLILSLLILPLAATPVGELLGWVVARVCIVMTELSAWMARPRGVVISLTHPAVLPIAIVMTAALLILLALRLPERRRWVMVLPLLVGWVAIAGVLTVSDLADGDTPSVSFLQPSSEADLLVLTEGRDAVICDFSNGSYTALGAAAVEASRRGATEIAAVVLTHYHRATGAALGRLFGRETVRALWVPAPTSAEEYYFLRSYMEKATDAGVAVHLYEPGEALHLFGACELAVRTTALERSTQPVILATLDTDPTRKYGGKLVYCGASIFESALSREATGAIVTADAVIFGNHGPDIKRPFGEDLYFRDRTRVVVSAEGRVAAFFRPKSLPASVALWFGQWRFEFS